MEPFTKIRILILGVLLTVVSTGTYAQASADVVSASDAQHFEQTYEDWAKSIIKSLNPKLDFTVISQVEFSRNPEHVQEYEDMKAANHLPGLPEIADPNYTNPLDSPLYALVAKKNFKIILYSALSQSEVNLVREVLGSKLKISGQDSLNFEIVNRDAVASTGKRSPMRASKVAILALAAGLMLLAGGIYSMRRRNRKSRNSKGAAVSEKSSEATQAIQPPATNPTISASHQIQMATPAILRRVLETENAELIARASLNATKKFSNRILGECEQNKFDLVIQWINANHKKVSHQDSNYARLLLAARLQQVQNETILNSIDLFNKARDMKTKLKATNKPYAIVPSPEVNEAKL